MRCCPVIQLLTIVTFLGGCSQLIELTITSDPAGAKVWAVPKYKIAQSGVDPDDWLTRTNMLDNRFRFGGSGVTPLTASLPVWEHFIFVRKGALTGWKEVTPKQGELVSIPLMDPSHE